MESSPSSAVSDVSSGRKTRNVPWCAIFLVLGAIICHTMVLMGNLATAQTFADIGKSTGGWSDVGIGVSNSMIGEIEHLMSETNHMLTTALKDVVELETMMNFVLGASGNSTQAAVQILAKGDVKVMHTIPKEALDKVNSTVTIPDNTINLVSNMESQLPGVKDAVKAEVAKLVDQLTKKVESFWKLIRPALVQVGKWLHSMGAKMQGFIEQFSQTIDKAQKIFDQLMSKMAGSANTKEELEWNTFNIFDCTDKGSIAAKDIQEVASLYGVTALAGKKGDELHKKYDANGDGELSQKEYSLFVDDSSIPGVMPYVLRVFSKRLSQIAGQMKGAKMRDEVAISIADYFQLMVAKNLTKTVWLCQALSNGSLPTEFSADVLKELVAQDRDPAKLTTLPIGEKVVGFMVYDNAKHVKKVMKDLADPVFWGKQGYDPKVQAPTIKQLKKWVKSAKHNKPPDHPAWMDRGHKKSLLEMEDGSDSYQTLVDELELLTDEEMNKRMRRHQQQKSADRIKEHEKIFHADVTKHLFKHLLGEVALKGAAADADVDRVTKGGVPAAPETLKFAKWLVFNATSTSDRFQHQAFDYAKTSSNAIDSFANQIQSFIKKVQQFLDLMMSYTTDRGIHELHLQVNKFIEMAAKDVDKVVDKLIDQLLISNGTTTERLSLVSLGSNEELGISGVWGAISDLMNAFKSILPTVIDDIKFAKKEVSSVASTLDSIFGVFKKKGSPIFEEVASLYRSMWIMYYILFFVLTGLILFYAFWAYEWFGGPKDKGAGNKSSSNCCARCCDACLSCMRATQDGHICFWSCILLSEMVILIMFVVSIVLCILAGVKAFVSLGCAQIYVLGDDTVCTGVLTGIRGWMETFWKDMPSDIHQACEVRTLVACKAISHKLMTSAMYTVGGSFAAATFSFQLLFLSAQLHERAAYNHKVDELIEK